MEIALRDNRTKDLQEVYFELEENSGYMKMILHSLAVLHTLISLCCIIGYYCLKVIHTSHTHTQTALKFCGSTHCISIDENKNMSLLD